MKKRSISIILIATLIIAQANSLALAASHAKEAQSDTSSEQDDLLKDPNVVVVMEMLEKWHTLDSDGALNMFTEDGAFHSMMSEPIKGHKALEVFLGKLFSSMSELTLDVRSLAVTGNTVILERFDSWRFNDRPGSIPVVGVFVVEEGKIKEWREYYDRATILKEMGLSEKGL